MREMNSLKIFENLEQLAVEIDTLSHQRLDVKNNDLIGISLLMVTQRIFNGYKAIKLLISKGFFLEATIIVRSVVESVFVFNDIIDKPEETILKLEQLTNYNKQKLHRNALKYNELKNDAEKFDFSDLDAVRVGVVDFAKLSKKNTQLYEIAYGLLCDEVHINQASLERLLDVKENVIVAIKPNHNAEDFEITYFTLYYCIHSVMTDLNQKFILKLDSQLAEMETLLEKVLPE